MGWTHRPATISVKSGRTKTPSGADRDCCAELYGAAWLNASPVENAQLTVRILNAVSFVRERRRVNQWSTNRPFEFGQLSLVFRLGLVHSLSSIDELSLSGNQRQKAD